jgi:hypothetical protein
VENDKEAREAFEALPECGYLYGFAKNKFGDYEDANAQNSFINFKRGALWQAARRTQPSAVGVVTKLREALEVGKNCCGLLISDGGAAATELSEHEYPQILHALKLADKFLGGE